ncbi:unnamed protein product [Euphydryas editha]|uniref:Uncharacterized protein n=1 Tax=Euphydryas editha TaxID=104508 RepID=A0AAU9TP51_EUPED|nr:unnamed protein product [Euphydryas editha]
MYQHARRKSKDWRHAPLGGNSTPAIEHFHEGNIGLHDERSPPTTRYEFRLALRAVCDSGTKAYFIKKKHTHTQKSSVSIN